MQQEQQLYLMVTAVRDEKVNDKRCFYACEDMRFLPDIDTDRKIKAVNPIQLSLHSLPIKSDGTFEFVYLIDLLIFIHEVCLDYHYDWRIIHHNPLRSHPEANPSGNSMNVWLRIYILPRTIHDTFDWRVYL